MSGTKKKRKSCWGDKIKTPISNINVISAVIKSVGNSQTLVTTPITSTSIAYFPKNETQQERQARRLYIGNIPSGISCFKITQYLNEQYIIRNPSVLVTIATLPVVN